MTETTVEKFLIETFESIGEPLLTYKLKDGIKVITNVSYPNKAFTRPEKNYWFEIHFLPTMPYQQELGQTGKNRWNGILQIDICVPKNTGTDALNARFNKIYETFKRGYITNGLRIISVGRTSARTAEDYCFQSVSIAWQADLEN